MRKLQPVKFIIYETTLLVLIRIYGALIKTNLHELSHSYQSLQS
jgi:hypothetical protein